MRNVAANMADENSHGPARLARTAVRGEDRGMRNLLAGAVGVALISVLVFAVGYQVTIGDALEDNREAAGSVREYSSRLYHLSEDLGDLKAAVRDLPASVDPVARAQAAAIAESVDGMRRELDEMQTQIRILKIGR